jgi:large-conductance mechanosensitive channel
MDEIKIGSNRSFGIVFFVVFLLIGLYPLLKGGDLKIIPILIAIIFLILGVINSKLLTPLNKFWFKFGLLLGQVISPIVMGVIFFLVVTPIGYLMRFFGKDVLRLKKTNDSSYWVKKSNLKSKMKNQF